MRIIGKKVVIRDVEPSDRRNFIVWEQDAEVTKLDPFVAAFTPVNAYSIDALNGTHIGTCTLYDYMEGSIQLGIRIGNKDYWNKGYGTDAVKLLTWFAFTTMSVNRVWLKVLPENTRAIRCYEKAGFTVLGKLSLEGYEFTMMEKQKNV